MNDHVSRRDAGAAEGKRRRRQGHAPGDPSARQVIGQEGTGRPDRGQRDRRLLETAGGWGGRWRSGEGSAAGSARKRRNVPYDQVYSSRDHFPPGCPIHIKPHLSSLLSLMYDVKKYGGRKRCSFGRTVRGCERHWVPWFWRLRWRRDWDRFG
jgi:hypothetical protein